MDRKGKISEIKHFTEKIFKTIESAQQDAVLSDAELDELLSYTSSITNRIISLRDDYKNEKINLLQEKLEELNNQIHSVFDELESVKSLKIQSRETFTAPQVESIIPEDLRDEIFDMTDVFSSEDELSESNVANEVKVAADIDKVENSIIEKQIIEEPVLEEPKTEIFAKPVVVELFDNQTNDIQKILLEEDGEDEDNLSLYDRLKENTPEWLTDYPGSKISDIWAGISLNDRICFIKDLFNEDQEQFKISIMRLNEMTSMDEVLEYTRTAFPYWDEESPTLYRFYMIIRRKIDV
ncbi:MAG: hypothetical protein QMB39_05345 [Bacteroidales bacterium]